jgi:hypothetical protein
VEVIYKRERGHNYILFPGKGEASIQSEMIRRNRIPGLARFYTEWEDNQRYYGYDITGAKPFGQLLEVRSLTRKEAEKLIEELAGILQGMEAFLLDRDKLVLKPELLYAYTDGQGAIHSGRQGFLFFFCEEQEGSYSDHLRELILYLLEKADGEDRELPALLFRLYRALAHGEPEPEELLACLGACLQEEKKAERFSNLVAEGDLGEWYGNSKQTETSIENRSKKTKVKKGLFVGKKEVFTKLLGKGPMPVDEMWDDLEPDRVPAKVPTGEKEMADHPTEVLYVVEETDRIPYLVGQEEEKILLTHFPFYIGTQPRMDYCPKFQGISRIHLKLEQRGSDIWITDLNSTNGTALNGEPLKPNEERKLQHGDKIWLAGLVYQFDSGKESW